MNGRNTILGGQRPHSGNVSQLQAIDMALRTVSQNPLKPPHSGCTILLNYHQLDELKILETRDPAYCISSTLLASGWAWFCPIGHERENSPVAPCLQTILGSGMHASERVAYHAKPQESRLTQIKHEVP